MDHTNIRDSGDWPQLHKAYIGLWNIHSFLFKEVGTVGQNHTPYGKIATIRTRILINPLGQKNKNFIFIPFLAMDWSIEKVDQNG